MARASNQSRRLLLRLYSVRVRQQQNQQQQQHQQRQQQHQQPVSWSRAAVASEAQLAAAAESSAAVAEPFNTAVHPLNSAAEHWAALFPSEQLLDERQCSSSGICPQQPPSFADSVFGASKPTGCSHHHQSLQHHQQQHRQHQQQEQQHNHQQHQPHHHLEKQLRHRQRKQQHQQQQQQHLEQRQQALRLLLQGGDRFFSWPLSSTSQPCGPNGRLQSHGVARLPRWVVAGSTAPFSSTAFSRGSTGRDEPSSPVQNGEDAADSASLEKARQQPLGQQQQQQQALPSQAPKSHESKEQYVFPAVDAEAMVRALEAERSRKDRIGLAGSVRAHVNVLLLHFIKSRWAADQALAIYINSSFFPTAASRFRKFVLRCATEELCDTLLRCPSAGHASDEFLFPLFAEFCFNEFADEIKAYRDLVNSADMTKPHTWYPFARAVKRRVVYHMGPTNSGKTHNALVRFKEAASGLYCGPLRLLAMEVYDRVNADGVYCNLVTGQERKEVPFAQHTACTIEMANLFNPVEVAVVDEIQMIADEFRGWAWTRALLGIQAAEIHLCGDPSALRVVQALCQATGDELVYHAYERFAPLTVDKRSLDGWLGNAQPGDCIVAFSRRDIFQIKREVELLARQRCCVVYGALPPETRRQQALLFNESGNGFDVLVASDAVGMGLNLNIRRVVFSSLSKFNGDSKVPIPAPMVKQIAGRAGRRGSMYEEGVTTCLYPEDVPQLVDALQEPVTPIAEAGLFPVFEQVELFASRLPEMTFAQLIDRFVETSRVDGQYFICRTDNLVRVAKLLEQVKGLSLQDRFHFCFAPANTRDPTVMACLLAYAHAYARDQHVPLAVPSSQLPVAAAAAAAVLGDGSEGGDWAPVSPSSALAAASPFYNSDLSALEARHQVASMYLWLSYHFPKEVFSETDKATAIAQGAAAQLAATLAQPIDQLRASHMHGLRHGRGHGHGHGHGRAHGRQRNLRLKEEGGGLSHVVQVQQRGVARDGGRQHQHGHSQHHHLSRHWQQLQHQQQQQRPEKQKQWPGALVPGRGRGSGGLSTVSPPTALGRQRSPRVLGRKTSSDGSGMAAQTGQRKEVAVAH